MPFLKNRTIQPQPDDTIVHDGQMFRCVKPARRGHCDGCAFSSVPCYKFLCVNVIYELVDENKEPELYSLHRLQGHL